MVITGTHDSFLVALSILIATVASYTALDLAGRIRTAQGWTGHAWLAAAAFAMGGGIWSMHFVAMLAFSMPDMAMNYDMGLTALSFVLPIVVTGIGFHVANRPDIGLTTLALSGLFMGLGIAGMHYTGMAAMRMPADLSYDGLWVAASVLIAIGASAVALWLAFRRTGPGQRLVAAVAMGMAVSGMHYAAMRAAIFTTHAAVDHAHGQASLEQTSLALAVAATTFAILFLALIAAMFDRRFALLAEREAAALRASEERYRTLYSKTPLPLHSLSEAGIIEHVSDAWLELLGYRREEVVGRPLTDFMTEDSIQRRAELVWPRLLREGAAKDVEYRLVTKTGAVLDVLMSGRVVRDAEGRFLYVLGGVVDVTARKKAEEALRQAQKIEAVGHLTGGVAHDFNNLLAVVLGNLELLRRRLPDDPKATRLLDNAMQGARRGAALTQRMLAFARRQDLKPEPVDVPDLVKGMADLLQRSIGPMILIETRFPLSLPCAQADANQLELALLNLVVNARDAMPEGGTITIAGREEVVAPGHASGLAPGGYVCLSVSDTGHGMDEATLARAMEPFFTTKGIGKGTGLGLSMVHGLAEQSGGRLMLKSRKGQGTTAEIWLPVIAAKAAAAAAPAQEAETAGARPGAGPFTILVVDDDTLVLQNTAVMLEDLGHRVLEASSGQEALEWLIRTPSVDLVITDHAMPGMTGLQLSDAIRKRWPHLPVILASGYAELTSEVSSAVARLNKPFRQEELARVVRQSMEQAAAGKVVPFRSKPAEGPVGRES
ncbi:MHYT domain-containing protein [Microvirga arsenatis]|uniref:histidine kinase n=1 Tax=Microvirga arsenatis TaxID=2692265 RepID=A0ABW9YUT0_9HYPH|nr:MHYT domain-containing protein [Microvirga arsenatis]NBJ13556.1 PAS domain S-box protein [Microvirga arsenatis]NBJ23865.1 PAS domain S-box protein [Microvirga arsenatis]